MCAASEDQYRNDLTDAKKTVKYRRLPLRKSAATRREAPAPRNTQRGAYRQGAESFGGSPRLPVASEWCDPEIWNRKRAFSVTESQIRDSVTDLGLILLRNKEMPDQVGDDWGKVPARRDNSPGQGRGESGTENGHIQLQNRDFAIL